MLENAQSPQRRVHALLGGTLLTVSTQSREKARTRGSKLGWQNDIAETLANIMTRPQANGHNLFVTKRRDLPNNKITNERNEEDKEHNSTKRQDGCAAMTRQTHSAAKKNKIGDRDGRQNKPTLFFSSLHFAQEPRSKKRVKPNGLRYRLAGETR